MSTVICDTSRWEDKFIFKVALQATQTCETMERMVFLAHKLLCRVSLSVLTWGKKSER